MATLWELFVQVSGDPSGFKKAMKESQDSLTAFEKGSLLAANNIGNAFSALGLKLGAVGIVAFAVHSAEEMEKASVKISRATGATGEALDSLDSSLKSLYAHSGRSAEEIAGALSTLTQRTGLTGSALESLTSSSMKFAKVTGSDLKQSVEENQRVFAAWSIGVSNQSEKMDELYVVATRTGISTTKLSETLISAGPALRSLGFSFGEAAALAGSFEKHGLNLDSVLGALQRGMVNLAAKSKDPHQAFLDLIARMRDAKTDAEAVNIATTDFGKRGAVVLADSVRRGAFETAGLNDEMKTAKGKVDDVAKSTKTLGANWKDLQHQLEVSASGPGNVIIKWANEALAAVNKVNSLNKAFVGALIDYTAGKEPTPDGHAAEYVANLPAPKDGGGGDPNADAAARIEALKKAFSSLGLKDLNKELAESVSAFRLLAGAGLLTHDQMVKAADGIQKLRVQLKQIKPDLGQLAYFADFGQTWGSGPTNRLPSLSDLQNLPTRRGASGMGVSQEDLASLPEYSHAWNLVTDSLAAAATQFDLEQRNIGAVTDAFHYFGQQTPAELEAVAKDAQQQYELMRESGTAAPEAIGRAWAVMFKAQLDAQLATGKITRQEYDDLVKQTDAAFGHIGGVANKTLGQELVQMTHRAFDNISRSIAKNIVEWKGWGESLKNIVKTIAEDVLNILISSLLKPLEDRLTKVLGKIGGGGGGGGAPSVPGGGGVGGAAGAASGGIGGVVSIVSGAVTAVSSVVGNFQMAGMNKSLDVLVNHTLRIFNELANFRVDAWTREAHLMLKLDDMWNEIRNVVSAAKSGGGGGGKGGVNFTNCTFNGTSPDAMMQAAFNQASLAGAI